MGFEGSEKKMEIMTHPESQSLRQYPFSFYESLLKKAKAKIVDQFSSTYVQSYILSESSLFVWDHRLILITCGQTTLADSVLYFIKQVKEKNIQAVFFQRKNEFFPVNQKSSFSCDVRRFNKKLNGLAYRFGNLDEHHFFLFHLDKEFFPAKEDQTIEVLMYGIAEPLEEMFNQPAPAESIRKTLNLAECFPGFSFHDYSFKPRGYSLNAVNKEKYLTIHATPQKESFYVSFETNIDEPPRAIINKILLLFRPDSFDVVAFYPAAVNYNVSDLKLSDYFRTIFSKKRLTCGFDVEFYSFKSVKQKMHSVYEWKSNKK